MRHVAVIDPGTRVPEVDCFNRMSRSSRIPLTYHPVAQFGVDSLHRSTEGIAGIVILGSGASVHDQSRWQQDLDDWLLPQIEAEVPVLGLCYGHQHLAHRLGGQVADVCDDGTKLKGVRLVALDPDPLWGDGQRGPLVVSHSQHVTQLPEGFEVRARSAAVPVEVMAHRSRPIWGFQAHPEATTAFTTNNDVPFPEHPSILAFGHALVDAFLERCGGS